MAKEKARNNFGNVREFDSIIGYTTLSIFLILYLAFSLTIFKLQIFPTINRITYVDQVTFWSITNSLTYDIVIAFSFLSVFLFYFTKKQISVLFIIFFSSISIYSIFFSINSFFLEIVFLISFPLVMIVLIQSYWKKGFPILNFKFTNLRDDYEKIFVIFCTILLILESYSILNWLILPIFNDISSNQWLWKINSLESMMFYSISLISPIVITLSILLFATRPIFYYLIQPIFHKFVSHESLSIQPKLTKISKINETNIQRCFVFTGIAISIFLPLYAYSNITSPTVQFLGTDIPVYLDWLNQILLAEELNEQFFNKPFFEINDGSRPFTLILFHSIFLLGIPYESILKFLPLGLGPILALTVYYMTKSLYPQSKIIAVTALLLTVVSHQIIIGFYAAFYANWLGLIFIFLSLTFMVKSINESKLNIKYVTLFGICLTISLLFHSYSWSFFVFVIVLYLIWTFLLQKRKKQSLKIVSVLGLILISVVLFDAFKTVGGSSDSFTKDLDFAESTLTISEFSKRWNNLTSVFSWYLGGYLSNFILIGFLLIWGLKSNYNNNSDRLIFSMLFVSILPVLFGDFIVQSRIFYNIPFQIPASIIIYKIFQSPKLIFGKVLSIVLILIMLSYALRAMANMEFIPSEFEPIQ